MIFNFDQSFIAKRNFQLRILFCNKSSGVYADWRNVKNHWVYENWSACADDIDVNNEGSLQQYQSVLPISFRYKYIYFVNNKLGATQFQLNFKLSNFFLLFFKTLSIFALRLPDGVMVAQQFLVLLVLVRIQVG